MEAAHNNFTVALRGTEGDERGSRRVGVKLSHPVPGERK
jgi:hypothetical protein